MKERFKKATKHTSESEYRLSSIHTVLYMTMTVTHPTVNGTKMESGHDPSLPICAHTPVVTAQTSIAHSSKGKAAGFLMATTARWKKATRRHTRWLSLLVVIMRGASDLSTKNDYCLWMCGSRFVSENVHHRLPLRYYGTICIHHYFLLLTHWTYIQ